MKPSAVRNILSVFLASPSDLNKERELARQVVDDLNKCIGRTLGWQIELLGWEDTLPGMARPQALINQDVAACDLFVGLLWKRWGQPTGEFSSGFEEEFSIATKRNGQEGRPEIWLAFKQVDIDLLKDPGDHLKRVIKFKSDRELIKDVLFKEFADEAEWTRLLHGWLLTYLLRQAVPTQGASATVEIATSVSSSSASQFLDSININQTNQPAQLDELVQVLSQCKDGYPFVLAPSGENTITSFHISRLYLLASTWLGLVDNRKLLETYAVNRIYESRELLEATFYETKLILRTIYADKFDLVPGWYWFKDEDANSIERIMVQLLMEDENEDIKLNVLDLMSTANLQLPLEQTHRTQVIKILLGDASESVKKATFSYLSKQGLPQDLEILTEAYSSDPKSRMENLSARIAIVSRQDPDKGFALALAETDALASSALKHMREHSGSLSADLLLRGLTHGQPSIRQFSAAELFHRGNLSDELVEVMLQDASAKVREIAYKQQIKRGIKLDFHKLRQDNETKGSEKQGLAFSLFVDSIDVDKLAQCYFESLSSEDLLRELDWMSLYGPIAYNVIARKYYPVVADRIRKDLEEEFESLKQESINSKTTTLSINEQVSSDLIREVIVKMLEKDKESIHKLTTRNFGAAALAGISQHGIKSDAAIARKYLSLSEKFDVQLRIHAIKILEQFGDESDAKGLIEIAKDSIGELRQTAVIAALNLSKETRIAVEEFTSSDIPLLVSSGLQRLWLMARAEALEKAKELLGSKNDNVREAVLYVISKELTTTEMSSLLDEYLKRPQHYYNVICWLDRLIFTVPLKTAYLSKLEKAVYSA